MDGLALLVIVVVVIVFIFLFGLAVLAIRRKTPAAGTPYQGYVTPDIWANFVPVTTCTGYQTTPVNATTPRVAKLSLANADNLESYGGGFPCTWVDRVNQEEYLATCVAGLCTGPDGRTYEAGGQALFALSCPSNVRCNGKLGLLAFGANNGAYCLSYHLTPGLVNCTLFDSWQYFIVNYNGDYLAQIVQRESGYCLVWEGETFRLRPLREVPNSGFLWLSLPQMTFTQNRLPYRAPAQLGWVGAYDATLINDQRHYRTLDSLREFITAIGLQTFYYENRLYTGYWYFEPAIGANDAISEHATTLVSINKLDQLTLLLS